MDDSPVLLSVLLIVLACILISVGMWGWPKYNVYQKTLRGEATLKEAEWSRQIKIKEAQAEKESAVFKKEADSIRAEGTAIANKIISQSLTKEYIQWKWVEGLHDGSSETIYIPTEANMPILEASRIK
jgi:regulator of protease activity HflC (stomatin/prohibitin superfamily)